MKSTVIFALTDVEVLQAIKYHQEHRQEQVYIVTPELSPQQILGQRGLPRFNYFNNHYYYDPYLHTSTFWNSEKNAVDFTQDVLIFLENKFPELKEYLHPLQSWLEMSYFEILETWRFFNAVSRKWNAKKYLISGQYEKQHTNLYTPFAGQWALLQKFFIPKRSLELITVYQDIQKQSVLEKISHLFHTQHYQPELFDVIADRLIRHRLNKYKSGRKYDVMIFSAGRHLNNYETLIKKLINSNLKTKIITSTQSLAEELLLKQKEIPYVPLSTFVTSDLNSQVSKETSVTLSKLLTIYRLIFQSKKYSRYGWPIINAFLQKTEFILKNNLPKIIHQTLLAREVIHRYSPLLLITTHDPGPTAMPFTLAAKRYQISSLLLMHGWQDTVLGVNHQSDYIAVWGKYISRWYQRKLGKSKQSIFSLGYPLFDDMFNQNQAHWQKLTPIPSLLPQVKIGLLLTMYFPNTAMLSKFLYELFSSSLNSTKKYLFSVRLHPNQPAAGIYELATSLGVEIKLNSQISLDAFISENDILLSWDTTAILWVMIYGKPLFYCAPNWNEGITPIKKLGGAWIVKGSRDFFEQIEHLRKSPEKLIKLRQQQKKFLKQVIGVTDGTSSEKHFRLINRLVKQSRLKSRTHK